VNQQKMRVKNESLEVPLDRNHIPALDGLRGYAVLLVLFCHTDAGWMPGGFIGVDVFFVLSGFLITRILVNEFSKLNRISFPRFYMRRLLRLAPALLLLCLIYLIFVGVSVALHISPIENPWRLAFREILVSLFYVANWYRAFEYYPSMYLLSHSWSLAIEEQFYIVWPIFLYFMLRKISCRMVQCIVVGVIIVSIWFYRDQMLYLGYSINRIYHGFDTRLDALLVGCFLALFVSSQIGRFMLVKSVVKKFLSVACPLSLVLLIVMSVLIKPYTWQYYTWGLIAIELITAIAVLASVCGSLGAGKWLMENDLLVWIGKISYGLYLWHYPVFRVMLDSGVRQDYVVVFGTLLSIAIAGASYYLVEKRFLMLKDSYSSLSPQDHK